MRGPLGTWLLLEVGLLSFRFYTWAGFRTPLGRTWLLPTPRRSHVTACPLHTSMNVRLSSTQVDASDVELVRGPLGTWPLLEGRRVVIPVLLAGWCGTPLGHLAIACTLFVHTSLPTPAHVPDRAGTVEYTG